MRVLIISPFWTSLQDVFEKNDIYTGMPAFIRPIIAMKDKGYELDYIFITFSEADERMLTMQQDSFIPSSHIRGSVRYTPMRKLKKVMENLRFSRELSRMTAKLIRDGKYDFVYGHSDYAQPAVSAAYRSGIACGQRLYGTFYEYDFMKTHSRLKSVIAFPFSVISLNKPKDFLIITNDGTHGDELYQTFCLQKKRVPFYFWLNGVNKVQQAVQTEAADMIRKYHIHQPSLFLLARVAECKRQDYAIEMLHKMALNGCTAHLYIVGQYSDDHNAWYDHLISMIGQYGLAEYVHFLGPLSRKENSILARVCTASLIASDVSCLGNVFHELLADGAVLICHDSAGSLNSYIEDRSNGFLISSPDEGAAVMERLIKGELPSEEIRQNAVRTSSRLMRSWEQRVEDELGLIEAAVQRHKESP